MPARQGCFVDGGSCTEGLVLDRTGVSNSYRRCGFLESNNRGNLLLTLNFRVDNLNQDANTETEFQEYNSTSVDSDVTREARPLLELLSSECRPGTKKSPDDLDDGSVWTETTRKLV